MATASEPAAAPKPTSIQPSVASIKVISTPVDMPRRTVVSCQVWPALEVWKTWVAEPSGSAAPTHTVEASSTATAAPLMNADEACGGVTSCQEVPPSVVRSTAWSVTAHPVVASTMCMDVIGPSFFRMMVGTAAGTVATTCGGLLSEPVLP